MARTRESWWTPKGGPSYQVTVEFWDGFTMLGSYHAHASPKTLDMVIHGCWLERARLEAWVAEEYAQPLGRLRQAEMVMTVTSEGDAGGHVAWLEPVGA